jgi:hypothetical protein
MFASREVTNLTRGASSKKVINSALGDVWQVYPETLIESFTETILNSYW